MGRPYRRADQVRPRHSSGHGLDIVHGKPIHGPDIELPGGSVRQTILNDHPVLFSLLQGLDKRGDRVHEDHLVSCAAEDGPCECPSDIARTEV
jgi:hypothetical protein